MKSDENTLRIPGAGESHPRFWWNQNNPEMLPYVYRAMEPDQLKLIGEWFDDTASRNLTGETSIPAISIITALISSASISRIVQLGHFAGYSTLMVGYCFVNSRSPGRLVSIDIDPEVTDYTRKWVERAGLSSRITLLCGDSSDRSLAEQSTSDLDGAPELIFLDSSHAYEHTLSELDLWYPLLRPGGMILLHDVSEFASQYDATHQGGVNRAIGEWSQRTDADVISINRSVTEAQSHDDVIYPDGCGLGIIQKPFPSA